MAATWGIDRMEPEQEAARALGVSVEALRMQRKLMAGLAFQSAMKRLDEACAASAAGSLAPLDFAQQRERSLADALEAMARECGVYLSQPLSIDGRGEFKLAVLRSDGGPVSLGTGQFGEALVELLNRHRPRTGIVAGTLCAANGWCHMNHFDVEAMVREYAEERLRMNARPGRVARP